MEFAEKFIIKNVGDYAEKCSIKNIGEYGENFVLKNEGMNTTFYTEGKEMEIKNIKNTIVGEMKELVNQRGAADIAIGRILYSNTKIALGKTFVKISFVDRALAKVSKKMRIKNEITELLAVLTALVVLKQFYDHKALENIRGYIVNRLYIIGIEATGIEDVLALINRSETQATQATQVIND